MPWQEQYNEPSARRDMSGYTCAVMACRLGWLSNMRTSAGMLRMHKRWIANQRHAARAVLRPPTKMRAPPL